MITSRSEFAVTTEQRVVELGGPFDGRPIDRFSQRMQLLIGSIEQDHSPIRKQSCKKTREGTAQIFSGPVRFP
jgi:hypothetical protein